MHGPGRRHGRRLVLRRVRRGRCRVLGEGRGMLCGRRGVRRGGCRMLCGVCMLLFYRGKLRRDRDPLRCGRLRGRSRKPGLPRRVCLVCLVRLGRLVCLMCLVVCLVRGEG